MCIEIYGDTKVYIACPANVASGGPELLHQLGFSFINNLDIPAIMYYYNFNSYKFRIPVHPECKIYNVPYVLKIPEIEDIRKNILIVPEVFSGLSVLTKYKNIRKGIWFLSVDNYYFSRLSKTDFFFQRLFNKSMKLLHLPPLFEIYSEKNLKRLVNKYDYRNDLLLKTADFYMTNTYRGLAWFKELKPLYYLSEYLNFEFLKIDPDLSEKQNIVAYNPKKGIAFTKKIISSAKDIKFVPIINMSRDEVIRTLQRAKVYIDFGNHPGKDRIPREAAILGCCVITGKRGSAAFFEDVSIPEEYKFDDTKENIPKIIEKIKDCFENFDKRYKDFDHYRSVIKNEPKKFLEDLRKIFVKV